MSFEKHKGLGRKNFKKDERIKKKINKMTSNNWTNEMFKRKK